VCYRSYRTPMLVAVCFQKRSLQQTIIIVLTQAAAA
jgi:hypothetical protein